MNNGLVCENSSVDNGGGAFIAGGKLTVQNGEIAKNSTTGSNSNGGGISIENGEVEMGKGFIRHNMCQNYGGGVYVSNLDATERNVKFTGGSINDNNAKYGGGLCVDGKIKLTVDGVEIAENNATNGGGICLLNNAAMNFGAGEIKNNKAISSNAEAPLTGYKKEISSIHGIGGGIYLNSSTNLEFTNVTALGLYNNLADYGADDIFANGNNTSITLPNVSKMALSDYAGASNLKWMEDYITDDHNYGYGTRIDEGWSENNPVNMRYRIANSNNQSTFEVAVDGGNFITLTKYVSLALGYEVINITITKYGLQNGESSRFQLTKGTTSFPIIITGNGADYVSKRVTVTAGEWSIRENDWSWSYNTTDPANKTITKDITDVANRVFVFKNSKINSLPEHDEAIKVNKMGQNP